MIEKDRITLTGDRIGHGRLSKVGAFLMSPTFCSVAIPTLFTVVSRMLLSPDDPVSGLTSDAKRILPWICLNALVAGMGARRIIARTNGEAKDKVINMNPSEFSLPTTEKWLTIMEGEKGSTKSDMIITGALLVGFFAVDTAMFISGGTQASFLDALRLDVGICFPYLYQEACRHYRAQKVLNFDWVVEDKGPPPEKVPAREKVRGLVQKLFPKTAPAGAS